MGTILMLGSGKEMQTGEQERQCTTDIARVLIPLVVTMYTLSMLCMVLLLHTDGWTMTLVALVSIEFG